VVIVAMVGAQKPLPSGDFVGLRHRLSGNDDDANYSTERPHALQDAVGRHRLPGSNIDAPDKPEYDRNDQYQAENAAESRSAVPIITMVAAEAAEQQDYQDDN